MNRCFNKNVKLLLRSPSVRRSFADNAQLTSRQMPNEAGAESWAGAAFLVIAPISGLIVYKKFVLDTLPDIKEVTRKPFTYGPEAELFRRYNPKPRDDDFGPPPKEPYLTSLMRKSIQHQLDESYKVQVKVLEENYERMMAHIEKKKFPDLKPFPSYERLFGVKQNNRKLPTSFDD